MKILPSILLAGCVALFVTPDVSSAVADSILAARIALVFPFQVGQQYEFQAAKTSIRKNGTHLPPFTIDTITVTDTTINGKTWLHVPYWNPFGSEYYRLDDSVRVWNVNAKTGEERVFLDLGYSGEQRTPGPGVDCPPNDKCSDHMAFYLFTPSGYRNRLGQPFAHLYQEIGEGAIRESSVGTAWTIAHGLYSGQYIPQDYQSMANSSLGFSLWTCCVHYSNMHGVAGPGTVQHRAWAGDGVVLIGYFRPVSTEPWPVFFGRPLAIREESALPSEVTLYVSPNPANATVAIRVALPDAQTMKLAILSATGQIARTLYAGASDAGVREIVWDGRDDRGRPVSSGIYIVRLRIGDRSIATRVVIAR